MRNRKAPAAGRNPKVMSFPLSSFFFPLSLSLSSGTGREKEER
jgi:hypothetical protein